MTDQLDLRFVRCACGGEASLSQAHPRFRYRCETLHCFCSTPWYPTQAEAIAAWNRMQGADEWQPIEAARPDTPLLFYSPGNKYAIMPEARLPHMKADSISSKKNRGYDEWPEARYTNWMPLPDPPSGGDNG